MRENRFFIEIIFHDSFFIIFHFRVWFVHDLQVLIKIILFWHFCVSSFVQIIFFCFGIKFRRTGHFFVSHRRRVILSQTTLICCEWFEFFNRILISICNLFKWTLNNKTIIFVFNIQIKIVLKMFVIIHKHLFCMLKNLLFGFLFNLLMNSCQIVNIYVMIEWIIVE